MRKRFGTVREWRASAYGAFGHGPADLCGICDMPCPYWGKSENEERGRDCAKHLRLCCVLLGAQAEAYATARRHQFTARGLVSDDVFSASLHPKRFPRRSMNSKAVGSYVGLNWISPPEAIGWPSLAA